MRDTPMWSGIEAVAHTLIYDGLVMQGTQSGSPLPAQRWASVNMATLVLDGGGSDAWFQRAAASLARILPHAHRGTLRGQAHAVAPEVLAPMIRAYLEP